MDQIFRSNNTYDDTFRQESVGNKKLKQGDLSWSTIKTVLGWIIGTTTMTIHLPEHWVEHLAEILASISSIQKRLSLKKLHKMLGELRSMSLPLLGVCNMFSMIQHALTKCNKTCVATIKGVYQALKCFNWMFNDIVSCPNHIAELVPLLASAMGYHNASGGSWRHLVFVWILCPLGVNTQWFLASAHHLARIQAPRYYWQPCNQVQPLGHHHQLRSRISWRPPWSGCHKSILWHVWENNPEQNQ